METFKGTSIPKKHVIIADCALNDVTKYELTSEQLSSYSNLFEDQSIETLGVPA